MTLACLDCSENCWFMLLSNKLSTVVDLLAYHLSVCSCAHTNIFSYCLVFIATLSLKDTSLRYLKPEIQTIKQDLVISRGFCSYLYFVFSRRCVHASLKRKMEIKTLDVLVIRS